MINSTNNNLNVQATNTTYETALQYASTAAKAICLLTAGIVIGKYFSSTPQSLLAGNSALADLDNHVFTPQNHLKSIAAFKDIVNQEGTSTITSTPYLAITAQSSLLPGTTPANFSTSIQPTLFLSPEKVLNLPSLPQSHKNSSTTASITFAPLLPKISSATKVPFTPLMIKAPSLPQSLKNASITASIISTPTTLLATSSTVSNITTVQSLFSKNIAEEIQVKNESLSATNLTIYQEFSLGKTIQKTTSQNPILNQSVETPVITSNATITNFPENGINDCSEEILECECNDELPSNTNLTPINNTEDEAQCTVAADSLGNKAINLSCYLASKTFSVSCNIASKAFNASRKVGKAVGKCVGNGLYNYLSANCYRRVRLVTAIGAAYRCDPRVRASFTQIYRNARS